MQVQKRNPIMCAHSYSDYCLRASWGRVRSNPATEPYQYQLRQLSELPTTNQDTARRYQSAPAPSVQAHTLQSRPPARTNSLVVMSRRVARPKAHHSNLLECEHKRAVLSRVEGREVAHENLQGATACDVEPLSMEQHHEAPLYDTHLGTRLTNYQLCCQALPGST